MNELKYYAGIGSRETPPEVLGWMTTIARQLSRLGYILRSGGAPGADTAFEQGAKDAVIYLPWNGFNGHSFGKINVNRPCHFNYLDLSKSAYETAERYHPAWERLSDAAKKLMARNTYQVLGDRNDPSEFVICWTKDGKASGGTGQAIRIAKAYNIPVYNLKNEPDKIALNSFLQSIAKQKE